MSVPGSKLAAQQRETQQSRREIVTDIDVYWKILDSEKPLTGKQKVQLQNLLVRIKRELKQ